MADQSEGRTDGRTASRHRNAAPGSTVSGSERPPAGDPTANRATAGFAYAPGAPVAGNPVLFEADAPAGGTGDPANGTDGSASDLDVSASETGARYEWTFGDGAVATGETASHVYDSPGEHPVALTVTDAGGATWTARRSVTVYREVEIEIGELDDGLLAVTLRGREGFVPADTVAVESLRIGAPVAVAMGSGASPVRSESREGDLLIRVRADETGLLDDSHRDLGRMDGPQRDELDDRGTDRLDADAPVRLAGRTTGDVPIAGTTDPA